MTDCSCETIQFSNGTTEVELCDPCSTLVQAQECPARRWAAEIRAMRSVVVDQWGAAENDGQKADVVRTLFTMCLGCEEFLAAKPVIRTLIAARAADARQNPFYGNLMPELLTHVEAMLARLPARDDYVP